MPTQTLRPSTIADAGTGGTLSWANPGNAVTSNNGYATVSFSGGEATSNWLYLSNFGFTIPSDATNVIANLFIERKADVALRVELDPYILLDGAVQADSYGASGFFTTSDVVETHFPLDLSAYTPAQINSSGFGVAFRLEFHNDFNADDVVASVDDVYLVIEYGGEAVASRSGWAYCAFRGDRGQVAFTGDKGQCAFDSQP
jgi:hypothetical protein